MHFWKNVRRSGRTASLGLALLLPLVAAAASYEPEYFPPPAAEGVVKLPALDRWLLEGVAPGRVTVYAAPQQSAATQQLAVDQLQYLETGYETADALVYQQQPGWLRLALQGQPIRWVWLPDAQPSGFKPMVAMVGQDQLNYFAPDWDRRLWSAPDGQQYALFKGDDSQLPRIIGKRQLGRRWWLQVRLVPDPCQDKPAVPPVVREGWLPLRDSKGRYNIWYHTRGC